MVLAEGAATNDGSVAPQDTGQPETAPPAADSVVASASTEAAAASTAAQQSVTSPAESEAAVEKSDDGETEPVDTTAEQSDTVATETDVPAGTTETALQKKVDSKSAWEDALKQADAVEQDTTQIDQTAKTELKEQEQKKKVDQEAEAAEKEKKDQGRAELQKSAGELVRSAVTDQLGKITTGAGKAASEAAAQAAQDEVQKLVTEAKEKEETESHALKAEAEITHTLDAIKCLKNDLLDVQRREKEAAETAKAKAEAFVNIVQEHVKRAKDHFDNLHDTLDEYHKTSEKLKSETSQLVAMQAKAADIHQSLTASQGELDDSTTKFAQEREQLIQEKNDFKAQKMAILTKMDKLVDDMKHTIKDTAVRKATPHADAEAQLNSLNVQIQQKTLKITALSSEIHQTKIQLDDAQEKEEELQASKDKRIAVLQLANTAYEKLQKSVATLQRIVAAKDITTAVQQPTAHGVQFTKDLASSIASTMKDAVKESSDEALKHLDGSLQQRTSDSS